MKIAIVSQYYPPEPVPIPFQLASELRTRGHRVRVVTGFPNYPSGRVYPGYQQRLEHVELDASIEIKRVPLVPNHSRNSVARFANYLSFSVASLLATRFTSKADVVYVYATQMTAAVAPSAWWRFRAQPFILHIQDLWPDSITASSMGGGYPGRIISRVLTPWLRHLYGSAAATIGISKAMSAQLVERGVPTERSHTVFNWADISNDLPTRNMVTGQRLSVVYAGNLGDVQDLETVVRAAAECQDLEGFTLTLVGEGVAKEKLQALVASLGANNIVFLPRVPLTEMGEIYANSDFQLISLKDLEVFRCTIPSKFQGSIARGIPVITSVGGEVKDIVEAQCIGFACEPGDYKALSAGFRKAYDLDASLRAEMSERARAYYLAEMAISSGIDLIEKIMKDAVASSGEARR